MFNAAQVTVPATTANIGPGFDCLGAALTLYNRFVFTPTPAEAPLAIVVSGQEAQRLSTGPSNLVYRSFQALYQHIQQPVPSVHIAIELQVPLSRGLGSSSTAIVGGLVGANLLAGKPLSQQELAALATELEGHPDNVVPALLGGCRLAVQGEDCQTLCELDWHPDIVPTVAVPEFELSTAAARNVLPQEYSRADAVFNTAHLGLLVRGLATGNPTWLSQALCDRIHQPYRKALIPGFDQIQAQVKEAGAWGLVISGAGPTLLALSSLDRVPAVAAALGGRPWKDAGIAYRVHQLSIDRQGTRADLINP